MIEEKDLLKLIREIKILISNFQLYSANSSLVKEGIKNVSDYLQNIINTSGEGKLVLGESNHNLLINGNILKVAGQEKALVNSITEIFSGHYLKSVTFISGFNPIELTGFFEEISKKKVPKDYNISKALHDKNIKNILVNEKVYIALGEENRTDNKELKEDVKDKKRIIQHTDTDSVVEIAKKLSNVDDALLIEDNVLEKLPAVIQELDVKEKVEFVDKIVEKVSVNLKSPNGSVRLKTATSFKKLLSVLESLSDKRTLNKVENKIIDAEERESKKEVYNELADLLESGTNRLIGEGNYEKTIKIIGMFKRHYTEKGKGFIDRWLCAKNVLTKISNRHVISIITSDLRSDDNRIKEAAYTVVMKLQDCALPQLIETIKETEDLHLRRVVAFVIKSIGEDAVKYLVNSLTNEISIVEAKRIIEVLDSIGSEKFVVDCLKNDFQYYHSEVKKEIMKLLSRIKTKDALEIIKGAINDYAIDVKKVAIELLGKVKYKSASNQIMSVINSPDDNVELKEKACLSLASMDIREAIPILFEIAKGFSFLSLKKQRPRRLRLSAVYALGKFTSKDASDCLRSLENHKDKEIKMAAVSALRNQQSKIKKREIVL